MSIAEKFPRLANIYRLLWAKDRMDALEDRVKATEVGLRSVLRSVYEFQGGLDQIQNETQQIKIQIDQSCEDSSKLGAEMYRIAGQTGSQMKILGFDLDALKSSLEVAPEKIDEFLAWKARNPIPKRPLVTVIVGTYNRARLLTERCIPSVLRQTYDHLELIVVGDACTDNTAELVSKINDPRLRFQNLTERGNYPADPIRRWMVAGTVPMNQGLSIARGDFITHLDDDDEFVLDRLEKLVKFAVDNECDFVWHPFWREDDDGQWAINQAAEILHGEITSGAVFYRSWFKNIPWQMDAYRLMEPGDWNRYRRIRYIGPKAMRYAEPLLKHYRERNQPDTARESAEQISRKANSPF